MRHYFSLPRPIPGHPGGMHSRIPRGPLPALTHSMQHLAARLTYDKKRDLPTLLCGPVIPFTANLADRDARG
jgi:hypothetical protein